MKYKETPIDTTLRNWFSNDMTRGLLRGISITKGHLRGLNKFRIDLDYPIAGIAGINGAGKSTLLALACCAYHNTSQGFRLPSRQIPYYTFKDFFIQSASEVSPQGIEIFYKIAHNNWRVSSTNPDQEGVKTQKRYKRSGGRWNDYSNRVSRNVAFIGIERVVPHYERSASRSYSRTFRNNGIAGWENKAQEAVSYILEKEYQNLQYHVHSKYYLPVVRVGETIYSGLNMGAGENALFEIFKIIHEIGPGGLLVIDEIELGLHIESQRRLMKELKKACLENKVQIIFSTHSKTIFSCLPEDARFFVENHGTTTLLSCGISPEYAMNKMGSRSNTELEVYLEDGVAKSLLSITIPHELRQRINLLQIGSAQCLSRQLAATYLRNKDAQVVAIFDGDQKIKSKELLKHATNMAENTGDDFEQWFKYRCLFLPGDQWPESWIVLKAKECTTSIATKLQIHEAVLLSILDQGLSAGKHSEFYRISELLRIPKERCLDIFTQVVAENNLNDFSYINRHLSRLADNKEFSGV